jgi:hypothetical protein
MRGSEQIEERNGWQLRPITTLIENRFERLSARSISFDLRVHRRFEGEIKPVFSIMIPNTLFTRQREQRLYSASFYRTLIGEFDPGSGRTLAACLTHASHGGPQGQPANGCGTREQSADYWGIAGPTAG